MLQKHNSLQRSQTVTRKLHDLQLSCPRFWWIIRLPTAQATHAAAVESGSLRSELKSLQANAKRTAAELKAHEKQSLLNDSATHQLKATMSSMEIAITNEKATVERLSSEMKVQISSLESQLQSVTITNQQTLFGLKAGHEKQVQTITEETAQLRSRVKQTQSDLANR